MRLILLAGFASISLSFSTVPEEIPFRVNRISDRITILIPGSHAAPAPTNVISTDRGLILVDTGLTPALAEATRMKIREELGRTDVRYIVNTHYHFDHTNGNQVYAGAEIIGHERVPAAMQSFVQGKDGFIASRRDRIRSQEQRLSTLDPESDEAREIEETNRFNRLMIDDLLSSYVPTPPTVVFSERMNLKVADLELRLFYFGRAHTDGDILIHIPALGVLYVGDLFHPDFLSVTANNGPLDVPRWLEVLGRVLDDDSEVNTVIGGHGMVKDRAWILAQFRYMKDLWRAVEAGRGGGADLEAVEARLPLDGKFAYLDPYFELASKEILNRHRDNIRAFWRVGQKSACEEIERVLGQSGVERARARFQEIRSQFASEFYVDEREFNALGYKLLRNERNGAEAVAVFELNAEAFPQSWNVWDSLAEGYMWGLGNRGKAKEYYEKSLQLNPESQSAKDNLSQIRGYELDVEGQTRAPSRFQPGQPTGIREPYFGQTPPGLVPEVFAPGIVSLAGHFEFSITFSPDGQEIFFTRREEPDGRNTMMTARREENGWTAPREAAFARGYSSNEPHITPDGRRLYFGCSRQQPGADRPSYGIWVTERTAGAWGEARFHGPGMFVSSSRDGDLYMTDVTDIAGGGIIRYPLVDGSYTKPERLGGGVNTPKPGAHAFIAPDESFMVFDSYQRPGGQGGEGDLWVCFRNPDGTWGEAFNLGDDVNTAATNFCPSLTPDGKFLFFSTRRDIYWVSAEVIHRLRPGR